MDPVGFASTPNFTTQLPTLDFDARYRPPQLVTEGRHTNLGEKSTCLQIMSCHPTSKSRSILVSHKTKHQTQLFVHP